MFYIGKGRRPVISEAVHRRVPEVSVHEVGGKCTMRYSAPQRYRMIETQGSCPFTSINYLHTWQPVTGNKRILDELGTSRLKMFDMPGTTE